MAYGDYYNPTNKSVSDGAIVYAEDINKINTAVDAGFDQVASDLDELAASIGDGGVASKDWATEDAGTRPDPILDLYSSRAYAAEAKDWASASGAITEASTGLPLVGSSSAKTQAAAAAASALAASGYVLTASNQAVAAAASASTASGFAASASGFATAASGFADDASDSADNASASALEASGFATSASGFSNAASGYADAASASASAASGYADDAGDYAAAAAASATVVVRNRNFVINGNFNHWTRATSQTSSGYGSDDLWYNEHSGSTKTHERKAYEGSFPFYGSKYYSQTTVTSVAGANNFVKKTFKVEGVNTFYGTRCVLTFYAKADSSKYIGVNFSQYSDAGDPAWGLINYTGEKILLSTTWTKYTVLSPSLPRLDEDSLNTWIGFNFWFDAGSSYNTQTGSLGQQSGVFSIAQVQLEQGTTATAFQRKLLGEELIDIYRYLEPIRGTAITGEMYRHQRYTVTKRTTPTVTIVSGGYGGANIDINQYSFRVGSTVAPSSNQDFTVLVSAEL